MNAAQLIQRLERYDPELEILIRCRWEGAEPNGNVFQPSLVVEDINHDTDKPFLALECDQGES